MLEGQINELLTFQFRLYNYYITQDEIKCIDNNFGKMKNKDIIDNYKGGINEDQIDQLRKNYGENVTEIQEKSNWQILKDEILSPFYIFQICSIILWFTESYQYYAIIILVTSILGIMVSLIDNKKQQRKIKKMSQFTSQVYVYRNYLIDNKVVEKKVQVNSNELVIGDVIEIPQNEIMACDIILLNGSCIVNESILTGESIPIVKSQLNYDDNLYDVDQNNKQNTLFAGTHCMETRYYQKDKYRILGIVSQIGFNTLKGQLVRSILFPKEINFQFYKDCLRLIGVMFILGSLGFCFSLYMMIAQQLQVSDIVIRALDVITITVPPALPTCMSIGIIFGLNQLKKKQIFCISPQRINMAGKINIMCFDKTGTLTEEGLDMYGVRVVQKNKYINQIIMADLINNDNICKINNINKNNKLMLDIMGSCHSITYLQGKLIGDPLELKMFESTQLSIEDNNENKYDELLLAIIKSQNNQQYEQIAIMRRFDFSSTLQRMSVIVRNISEQNFKLFVKGSPEKIRELCLPQSIPNNFHSILEYYAQNGYRVIACAYRNIKISYINLHKVKREKLEQKLEFIGFIIMANKLKQITKSTIQRLKEAKIRNIMVTGDNILTAISVAKQSDIINKDQIIYIGENQNNNQIIWKDIYFNENKLDCSLKQDYKSLYSKINFIKSQQLLIENSYEDNFIQQWPQHNSHQNQYLSQDTQTLIEKKKQSTIQKQNNNLVFDIESQNKKINGNENSLDYTLAIDGKIFNILLKEENKEMLLKVLKNCQIYARMKPDDKKLLIQLLQDLEQSNVVGMCGDGANDCGALKMAHVGVSLSESEASIAAPFTSKIQNIGCIIKILREGRCSLTTAFQCIKFMSLYSFIQFATVSILYGFKSNLDLILIFPLAGFMSYTRSYKVISNKQPNNTLMCFEVLFSVSGQIFIQILFQIIILMILINQSWYTPCYDLYDSEDPAKYYSCQENNVLFKFSNFQYISTAFTFSLGEPFKRSILTNYKFVASLIILIIINIYLLFNQSQFINDLFYHKEINTDFIYVIIIGAIINFLITFIFEKYVIEKVQVFYQKYIKKEKIQIELN